MPDEIDKKDEKPEERDGVIGVVTEAEVGGIKMKFARWFLLAFSILVGIAFVMLLRPFGEAIFIAFVLFILGRPLYERLKKLMRGRRKLASIAACLVLVVIIIIPLLVFTGLLASQAYGFYEWVNGEFQSGNVQKFLDVQENPYVVRLAEKFPWILSYDIQYSEMIGKALGTVSKLVYSNATAFLKGVSTIVVGFFLVMIITFYLFLDGDDLIEEIKKLSPLDDRYDQEIIDEFSKTIRVTFKGSLVIALVQGSLGTIGFAVAGIRSWALWGAVMAIASFIPVVGTGIIWVPAVIYLLVTGNFWQAGFLLAWGVLVIGLSDNLVRTWIHSGETKIHPLLIFFSVLGGISTFGALGIVLGPLVLSLLVYILRIYRKFVSLRKTA